MAAPPKYSEVTRVHAESVVRVCSCRQLDKKRAGRLGDAPAHVANEMAVIVGGQVIRRRPMPEMTMDHDAEPLELVEVAVDRRHVDVGR